MKINLIQGDITTLAVDAIVNAANSRLMGGGGVDGAIHRAGGPAIMKACNRIRVERGGCPTGQAVITTAGRLPAKNVIHTAGPIWTGGKNQEPALLRSCYVNSLKIAEANECRSIAFPNISTGIYGFPKDLAAEIALSAVHTYKPTSLKEVTFVCFDRDNFDLYQRLLGE